MIVDRSRYSSDRPINKAQKGLRSQGESTTKSSMKLRSEEPKAKKGSDLHRAIRLDRVTEDWKPLVEFMYNRTFVEESESRAGAIIRPRSSAACTILDCWKLESSREGEGSTVSKERACPVTVLKDAIRVCKDGKSIMSRTIFNGKKDDHLLALLAAFSCTPESKQIDHLRALLYRTIDLWVTWFGSVRVGGFTKWPLWIGPLKGMQELKADSDRGIEMALGFCAARAFELLKDPAGFIKNWPNAYPDQDHFILCFEGASAEAQKEACFLYLAGEYNNLLQAEHDQLIKEGGVDFIKRLRAWKGSQKYDKAIKNFDKGHKLLFRKTPNVDDRKFPWDERYKTGMPGPGVTVIPEPRFSCSEATWARPIMEDLQSIFFIDAYEGVISPFAKKNAPTGKEPDHKFPYARGGASVTLNRQDIHPEANRGGGHGKSCTIHTFFTTSPNPKKQWYTVETFLVALKNRGPLSLLGYGFGSDEIMCPELEELLNKVVAEDRENGQARVDAFKESIKRIEAACNLEGKYGAGVRAEADCELLGDPSAGLQSGPDSVTTSEDSVGCSAKETTQTENGSAGRAERTQEATAGLSCTTESSDKETVASFETASEHASTSQAETDGELEKMREDVKRLQKEIEQWKSEILHPSLERLGHEVRRDALELSPQM
jgi:hypothetical protein